MSAQIIDGKALAAATKAEAAAEAAALKVQGIEPCLAVILVGENPASQVYVRGKVKDCGECGIKSLELRMPETTTQEELLAKIAELAADKTVNGILVQLPLPKQIDERAVIDAIPPEKDVDGFSPVNVGRMQIGEPCYLPCTPAGCIRMIESTGTKIDGKNAVVIGRSNIVGKPAALLLLAKKCNRYGLPFPHGQPERNLRQRGYSGCSRWPRWFCDRRYGQARRRGDRCWHQPRCGRQAARRCEL